jgi:septal ring factor EnvC (AmiA/AmiB activator)
MRKLGWSFSLLSALASVAAHAAATVTEQIPVQEELVSQIDSKINEFKTKLRERTLSLHKLQQLPDQGPLYIWQNQNPNAGRQRDMALRMASLSLKEGLKELDALENRRLEAQAELEWLRIQQEELSASASSVPDSVPAKVFHCRLLPVASQQQKPEVLQDYGRQKDSGTGLEWNSLGWWISAIGSDVRACDTGRVVFVGDISGRGRVVMLDHGSGNLTVYANLDPISVKNLQKGARVEAGSQLGRSNDRLYFEYRVKGVATNPREALRPELVEQIAF